MKKFISFIALIILLTLLSFVYNDDPIFVIPKNWPKPTYNFINNPLTKNKIKLGRALFYDPILSLDNTISCASCHTQYSAFTHVDHALSHGINDKIGKRNSPALMNLAWQKLFMYDGAVNHLDMQALAPISNPIEMNEDIGHVISKLQKTKLYPLLFYKAFNDSTISGERLLKSFSQFMLTLVTFNSKYDSVMRKESQFTDMEKKGYQLFKKNCESCHKEPLFSNYEFMNNGLAVDTTLKDFGRYGVTKFSSDSLKFKVPSLRNIEFSYPYMHDGRFNKLSEVLNHYTSAIVKSKTLAQELNDPINLDKNEKVEIIAFLLTLSDKSFLFNPQFSYPKKVFLGVAKD
jgi:cytochrome c peroxidase